MKKRNWFGILESKYAKNQPYRWPLLIEDANNVVDAADHCFDVPSLEEGAPLTIELWFDLDSVSQESEEYEEYENILEEYAPGQINRIDPYSAIREWDFETIICSALFFIIEKDLRESFSIFFSEIFNLFCVQKDPVRKEVFFMLKRNGIIEAHSKKFIEKLISSLKYGYENFLNEEGLFWILQLLNVEKKISIELIKKENRENLITFLQNFTYKSPVRFGKIELKNFLDSFKLEDSKYQDFQDNLENFDIWNAVGTWDEMNLPLKKSIFSFDFNFQQESFKDLYLKLLKLQNYEKTQVKNLLFENGLKLYNFLDQNPELEFLPFPATTEVFDFIENCSDKELKEFSSIFFVTEKEFSQEIRQKLKSGFLITGVVIAASPFLGSSFSGNLSSFKNRIADHAPIAFEIESTKKEYKSLTQRVLKKDTVSSVQNEKQVKVVKGITKNGIPYTLSENKMQAFGNVASHSTNQKANRSLRFEAKRLGFPGTIEKHDSDHLLHVALRDAAHLCSNMSVTFLSPSEVNQSREFASALADLPYDQSFSEFAKDLIERSTDNLELQIIRYGYERYRDSILAGYDKGKELFIDQIQEELVRKREIPEDLTMPYTDYNRRLNYWEKDCKKIRNLPAINNPEKAVNAFFNIKNNIDQLCDDGEMTRSLFPEDSFASESLKTRILSAQLDGKETLRTLVQKNKNAFGNEYPLFMKMVQENSLEKQNWVNKDPIETKALLIGRRDQLKLFDMYKSGGRLIFQGDKTLFGSPRSK
jgi:hypothetical protein